MESFQYATAEGWIFGSESGSFTPALTAGGLGIDTSGNGWLRLTTAGGNQSNYAYLDSAFKTVGNEVSITFDYTVHSGSGADGITFFMFDAAEPFNAGAFGGSLGYANRNDTSPLSAGNGMAGGYFGLGIDTYGNYSNPTEGRNGGIGARPDEIVLRGPGDGQSGYDYIAGTGGINTTDGNASIASLDVDLQFSARPVTGTGTEDNYYTINIYIDPDLLLTVSIDSDLDGNFEELFVTDLSGFDVPDELKLGYTASTGGSTNIHEIRNLQVVTTSQPVGAQYWDSDVNDNWSSTSGGGTISNWVSNGQPVNWADIFFGDDYNGGSPNAPETVNIQVSRNVRSISFDNAYNYTINDSTGTTDSFVMNAPSGGNISINVSEANYTPGANNSVTHTITVPITLQDDLTITNVSNSANLALNGNFTTNNNDITVNTTGAGLVTINGTINGSTVLTKGGSGRLILNGANTYTGDTDINGGTVQISAENRLGANPGSYDADRLRFNGGTLNTTATFSMSANRGITLDAGGGTFDVNSGTTLTLNSDIVGSGGLIKTGGGTLDLNGDNSDFTGGLTINAGKVTAIDTGEITLGVDDTNDNFLGAGAVTLNAGELEVRSTGDSVDLNGVYTQNGGTATFTSDINDVLVEGSANVTINSGTVNINIGGGTAGDEDNFLIDSNASWTQTGGTTTVNALSGSGNNRAILEGALTVSGSGTVFNINTAEGLFVDDQGPTPQLNILNGGVIDVSGDVALDEGVLNGGGANAGELRVGGNFRVDVSGGPASISGTPNVTMDGTGTQSVQAYDNAGALTGIGTFKQAGTSTTTISSTLTSFGANKIVVEAGTLLLGRDNQITNSTNFELAGGTFGTGGYDDTVGTLTLTADSTIDLAGGNSVFHFAASGGTTWASGEELFITNWGGTPVTGGGSDQLYFGSNSSGLTSGQVDQIIFVNPNGLAPGLYYAQILGDGEIVPGLPVVPEPSTYFGGGLLIGLGGLHFWRRRRVGRDKEDRG